MSIHCQLDSAHCVNRFLHFFLSWYKKNVEFLYGAHSVPKAFDKLIPLANEVNQLSVFNKITVIYKFKISCFYNLK